MLKSLGVIEFSSIAKGIEVADKMVKAATVEMLMLRHVCPGKFMVILCGEVEDVNEAVNTTLSYNREKIVESAVISNAHEDLISSLRKRVNINSFEAIGVFETSTITSTLIALDSALKSASVALVRVVLGNGIGGKSYFVITGAISNVEEAIKTAFISINPKKLIYKTVIPSPSVEIINNL